VAGILGTTQDKNIIIPEIKELLKKEDKLTAIKDDRPLGGPNWVISFIDAMEAMFSFIKERIKEKRKITNS